MQDRPTAIELLAAIEDYLADDVLPALEGARRFQTRVALNALRIVRREIEHADAHLASEWAGLRDLRDALSGTSPDEHRPPEDAASRDGDPAALRAAVRAQTEDLCARIRGGEADAAPARDRVLAHVRASVRRKLEVSNPDWLTPGRRSGSDPAE